MAAEEEIEFKVVGAGDCINPYLEKMINYQKKTRKNLYSFLLTLSTEELANFTYALMPPEKAAADDDEKEEEKWGKIGRALSIMAYSMERGRNGGPFETTIEELCQAGRAFGVASGLAIQEKMGFMRITDESYFFDINCSLKMETI